MYEASDDTKRRRELELRMKQEGRLPPGQSLTIKWPVLHYGSVPTFDANKWYFGVAGLVEKPVKWSYKDFMSLPKVKTYSDFHCVTRWSRFDNEWEGIAVTEVLKHVQIKLEANFVMVHGEQGYTANIPLADITAPGSLFAYKNNGKDLSADHGWPLRLVVPHLYAWKSVKWVRGLELMKEDKAGFWERNGYHIYGDPFKEQRFDDD